MSEILLVYPVLLFVWAVCTIAVGFKQAFFDK